MIIVGLEKFTSIDYPGHLSALIYTYGCTMRCPFCHNPELVVDRYDKSKRIHEADILNFLEDRKGLLEALAITGGEPSIHKDLTDFMLQVKDMGFKVKLDTYGLDPDRVAEIIEKKIVDYWAMDVKGNSQTYLNCGYNPKRGEIISKVKESIKLIMENAPDYEFRTTVLKSSRWHTEDLMKNIGENIRGAKNYYIQNFRAVKTLDPKFIGANNYSFTENELEKMQKIMENYVENVGIRN